MINKINEEGSDGQKGFIKLIIVIIIALLLMQHFHLTISGILAYFHLSWFDITNWVQNAWNWFTNLFNSVK